MPALQHVQKSVIYLALFFFLCCLKCPPLLLESMFPLILILNYQAPATGCWYVHSNHIFLLSQFLNHYIIIECLFSLILGLLLLLVFASHWMEYHFHPYSFILFLSLLMKFDFYAENRWVLFFFFFPFIQSVPFNWSI